MADTPAKPRRRWSFGRELEQSALMTLGRRRRSVVLIAASVSIVGLGGWLAICRVGACISPLGRAYDATLDTNLATVAITKYVAEQKKWPTSWDDLQAVLGASAALPAGRWRQIQSHVEVDFNLTLEEVGKQSAGRFDAIKSREPPAPNANSEIITTLLETIRTVPQADADSAKMESK